MKNFENIIELAEQSAEQKAKEPMDLSGILVDYTQDIPRPVAVIADPTNTDRIVVSEENLFVIAGEAKSRKSFAASLLIIDFFHQHPDRSAILIDTEQAKWNVINVARRICRGMGWDYGWALQSKKLQVAHLRPFPKKKRKEIAQAIILQEQPYLCIIDGARDLVTSVNDDTECSELVDDMCKWSEDGHCAIGTIIHTNKDGETVRGHLGAELINKAETTLFCKKDGDRTKLSSRYARNIDIDSFWFAIGKDGVPYRDSATETKKVELKCGTPKETEALNKLPMKEMNRSQWIAEIRVQAGMISQPTAEKYFRDYVDGGYLRKCSMSGDFYGHYGLYDAEPEQKPAAPEDPELPIDNISDPF